MNPNSVKCQLAGAGMSVGSFGSALSEDRVIVIRQPAIDVTLVMDLLALYKLSAALERAERPPAG